MNSKNIATNFVIRTVEEKWGEYLELLPQEQRAQALAEILAGMWIKQQDKITYLERICHIQRSA